MLKEILSEIVSGFIGDIKAVYPLWGKKKLSYEDYLVITRVNEKPCFKRVLRSYFACFKGIGYMCFLALKLVFAAIFTIIYTSFTITFFCITIPFNQIIYAYWYKKAMKQKERILREAKEGGLI